MPLSSPFSQDLAGSRRNILAYKVSSLLSFLLQLLFTIYLASHSLGSFESSRSIFDHTPTTPFTLSRVFVTVYWVVLWLAQIIYISHLFRSDEVTRDAAAAVGFHFISFNILHVGWLLLWCTYHPLFSEIVVVANFFNLTCAYFRFPSTTRAPNYVHLAVSALPLTFEFFLLLWNSAIVVHCYNSLVCRILANVTVWGIVAYAGFFLLGFNDFYVGFATAFLAAGLGVEQFFIKGFALQWPFAFAVMAISFLGSAAVAMGIVGRQTQWNGERAPLLGEA